MTGASPGELRGFEDGEGTKGYVLESSGKIAFTEMVQIGESLVKGESQETLSDLIDSEDDRMAGGNLQASSVAVNKEFLALQHNIQQESRRYQTISNAITASHQSANNSVRNMKGDSYEGGGGDDGGGTEISDQPYILGSGTITVGSIGSTTFSLTGVDLPDVEGDGGDGGDSTDERGPRTPPEEDEADNPLEEFSGTNDDG